MPIFMDRHDLTESVNAEHVAHIHQEDLKIEHEFGCKGLTYWFDDQRKTAFCLIKAPSKEALQEMHNAAHGAIPNSIIEVDPSIVESFLGRIEDPVKAKDAKLNIINDPAFRTLMVLDFRCDSFLHVDFNLYRNKLDYFNQILKSSIVKGQGRMVKNNLFSSLVSFRSITDAVDTTMEIHKAFTDYCKTEKIDINLDMGLCCGLPVTEKKGLFEDAIKMAARFSKVVKGEIVISTEAKELYESENLNSIINNEFVRVMQPSDQKFLNLLMNFTEENWNKANLKIEDFTASLGLSKSQLYRKVKFVTGKSLNIFIKDYRMTEAVKLLGKNMGNISEIAFDTGFNSPAYFSKCFYETYGILPSSYPRNL